MCVFKTSEASVQITDDSENGSGPALARTPHRLLSGRRSGIKCSACRNTFLFTNMQLLKTNQISKPTVMHLASDI